MIYVYGALSFSVLLAVFAGKKYKASFFEGLDKKEHPLRLFYGISLKIYEILKGLFPSKADSKTEQMIRRLCVKENAGKEAVIYGVKKISMCIAICLAVSLCGFLYCAANYGTDAVTALTRNEYGSGQASYELGISYDGTEETVEIDIEERMYTDEEIYALFDEAYEAVRTLMLADNESADCVSSPLDLVSEYGEIDIYWETDDTQSLDYNGEITAQPEDGESITVNLYATFSIEDVAVMYTYPVTLVSETLSEAELLIEAITEAINENNSIYESEVELPSEIDGQAISFFKNDDTNEAVFLVLGLAALIAVILVYDKKLEEKMKERENQMMLDFTEIVIKLSLLYEAGLSILKAWERIITDYETRHKGDEHFAYREMKLALEKIKSGMSEGQAYEEFGMRCALHPYIRLGNILSQNLSKGSRGMKLLLSQEAETAFEERKRLARRKGEEAGTKLLIPMILLLVVVIVIVAVPALMSISL